MVPFDQLQLVCIAGYFLHVLLDISYMLALKVYDVFLFNTPMVLGHLFDKFVV